MDIENPILNVSHPHSKIISDCSYRHCDEQLYEGQGYEYDGFLYCSTSCIGEELMEEGLVIDLSQ